MENHPGDDPSVAIGASSYQREEVVATYPPRVYMSTHKVLTYSQNVCHPFWNLFRFDVGT